ncbi:hypothetical protein FOL47_009674 [Perkinsus chesapeaki]|uniref:Nucleoporin Nup54 alpha-helical domain-containing protein n=1 Tax=Perkinsus chesapeaki TaxID=330153 RepID=A0A7J6MS37_PERCH|nr:hypothetical protein FOL47_009674 [Perkinsus chesapeaki]
MFGASTGSTSLFGGGGAQSSGGSLFGSTPQSSGGGLFGSTPSQQSTGGLFGATPSTGGSLFGGGGASSSGGSLFGGGGANTGGGLFGSTQASGSGGLFGSTQTSGSGGLFGSTPSSGGGGLFGSTQSSGGGGGLFGSTQSSGSSLFGGGGQPSGGGLFGGVAGSGSGLAAAGGLQSSQEAQAAIAEFGSRMNQITAATQPRMIAFTYVMTDNKNQAMQVFAQPYQSSVHGPDQMKWQMAKDLCPAMLDRPDSAAQGVWAYPVPMTSVDQMVSRVSEQQKLVAQAEGMMDNVKVQYSNLEGYVSVTTLKELEKARLRHHQLVSKLTKVTALIDKLAQSRQPQQLVGGAYAQAEASYSELERRAAVVQGRFAEARYKASMAEQRSGTSGGPVTELSSADQQKLLKIVKDQTICIQQLQAEMRKTASDVDNVHSKAMKSHQQQYRAHGDPLRALGHM